MPKDQPVCLTAKYLNVELMAGMWFEAIANATHFCTPERAHAYAQEYDLANVEVVGMAEHATPDTGIDDDDDPNAGEDWKNGPGKPTNW